VLSSTGNACPCGLRVKFSSSLSRLFPIWGNLQGLLVNSSLDSIINIISMISEVKDGDLLVCIKGYCSLVIVNFRTVLLLITVTMEITSGRNSVLM